MFLKLDNQFIQKTLGTVELVLGHMSAPGRARTPQGASTPGTLRFRQLRYHWFFTEHLDKFG
jgi:hypothetical protein